MKKKYVKNLTDLVSMISLRNCLLLRHPFVLGCFVFILQILAVLAICPEKKWIDAWLSLATHWDSEWYAAIAQYGYINIDGPVHCGLKNANVVFFPGYPYLARALVLWLHLNANTALLIVSQTATLLFWCGLFYILRHLPTVKKLYTAGLILVFPTSWFMVMGYSESLFILVCCMTLWWFTEKQWLSSGMMGIVMTATRLIGLPVLAAPFFSACIVKFSHIKTAMQNSNLDWLRKEIIQPNLILMMGIGGVCSFFVYCAYYFGSWHLYFDMESIHWSGTADPLFLFRSETWLPPPWSFAVDKAPPLPNIWSKILFFDFFRVAAYTFSEILVPFFMWLQFILMYRIYKKSGPMDEKSLIWFVAGVLIFLFTCFSLATRHYESMSRCLLPVWILWVISDVLLGKESFFFPTKQSILQYCALACFLFISIGFWLEMLNRFCLGWWVA
ncbi:MAG: hypothetical protein ACO1N3_00070 [Gammaproteobacteria bacterium]